MKSLQVIHGDEVERWDTLVQSFSNHDVVYLNGYSKAFQLIGDGDPLLLYYDSDGTRAMNVVMKRDIAEIDFYKNKIPKNTYIDLCSPYGYGGFLVDGEDYVNVNEAYESYCKENGYISEFVRFHLFSDYQPHYKGVSVSNTRNVVRDLNMPLEQIFCEFEPKVRKNINRANKSGLQIKFDASGEKLDDFLGIYYKTMNRTQAGKRFFFPKQFFKLLNKLEGNFIYVYVLYEEKVISTELVLFGPNNCYSFLGGTDQDYFHLRPNDFLKVEIIKWAHASGLKRFVLGGGYGSDDGIYRYKKSFAPDGVYNFYIGKRIFDQKVYDALVKLRASEGHISDDFFPKYRSH